MQISESDRARIKSQLQAVDKIMADGQWYTITYLALLVEKLLERKCMTQSISARIRDLRKTLGGSHDIAREDLGDGIYQYRRVDVDV